MKKLLSITVFIILSIGSPFLVAGERHFGTGETKMQACEIATEKAKAKAERQKTCYDRCEVSSCEKVGSGDDAYYKCSTLSANYGNEGGGICG